MIIKPMRRVAERRARCRVSPDNVVTVRVLKDLDENRVASRATEAGHVLRDQSRVGEWALDISYRFGVVDKITERGTTSSLGSLRAVAIT